MTTIPAGLLVGPARALFYDVVRFYQVNPHALLRVLIEMMLDAASEDGDLQRQLVESAQHCEQSGEVLGCWLNLEGGDEDAEPDVDTEPDDAVGGDDGDEDGSDHSDEDMDTGERHDMQQIGHPVCVTAGDDLWWTS